MYTVSPTANGCDETVTIPVLLSPVMIDAGVPADIEVTVLGLALAIDVTVALAVPKAASVMSILEALKGVPESDTFAVVGHVPVHVYTLRGAVASLMPLMVL